MVNRSKSGQRPIVIAFAASLVLAATGQGATADGGLSFLSAPAFDNRPAAQPTPAPAAPLANTAPAVSAPSQVIQGTSLLDVAPQQDPQTPPTEAAPLLQAAPLVATGQLPLVAGPTRPAQAPAFDAPTTPFIAAPSEQAEEAPAVAPLAPPAYDRALAGRMARMAARLSSGSADLYPSDAEVREAAGLPLRPEQTQQFRQQPLLPMAQGATFNLRLALAMLSQGRQREDDERVRLAQGTRGDTVLSLSGGLVTLDLIRSALSQSGLQPDAHGPFRVPVILTEDTVLSLGPDDLLEMSRPDGAFLLSFGRVEIDGATIRSHGEQNAVIGSFAPFVVVAGTGSMTMRNAVVSGLGFGDTAKYAGISVLGHPLRPMAEPTQVTDNHLSDVVSIALTAVSDSHVAGNRFADMRGAAVRVMASPNSTIVDNTFYGAGATNAIRVLDRSHDARLSGNILLSGERAGIVVRRSNAPMIENNLIWGRDGGGIKLQETVCAQVAHNSILDSKQKGVEVRSSTATILRNNLLAGNRSAGVWISAQADDALTQVTANRLTGNGAGLVGATAATVALRANDLTAQMPRLADGDLTFASLDLARDLTGATEVTLSGAGATAPVPMTCTGDEA